LRQRLLLDGPVIPRCDDTFKASGALRITLYQEHLLTLILKNIHPSTATSTGAHDDGTTHGELLLQATQVL
jgi:hypothetical protein